MAYNTNPMIKIEHPGQGHEDDYYNSGMGGRTPSPGVPMHQGYQLEDAPYHANSPGGPLQIPMGPDRIHTPGDRLEFQPTVSNSKLLCETY